MATAQTTGGDSSADRRAYEAVQEAAARDVATWPDVTPEQRKRLALLLWPATMPGLDT